MGALHQVLEFFASLPACLVGIEACPNAHHWAREISKLGHEVRLMPPGYVKPYVKRGKNDRADAEAICEAVQRPTMRFVSIKSEEQQALLVLHRVRETLGGQRIQLINTIRGHMCQCRTNFPQKRRSKFPQMAASPIRCWARRDLWAWAACHGGAVPAAVG